MGEDVPYGKVSQENTAEKIKLIEEAKNVDVIKEMKYCVSYPNIDQVKERKESFNKTSDLIKELTNEKELLVKKKRLEKGGLIKGIDFSDIIDRTNKNIKEKKEEVINNISSLANILNSSKEKIDTLVEYIESLGQENENMDTSSSKEKDEIIGLKAEKEKERLIIEVKIIIDEIEILEDEITILDSEDDIDRLRSEIAGLEDWSLSWSED